MSNPIVREGALRSKEQVLSAFKSLCVEDYSFMSSIDRATAGLAPTKYRFDRIAHLLQNSIGQDVSPPLIKESKRA